MTEFFVDVLQIATPIFAISSMLAVGFSNSARQILDTLRNWQRVAGVLVASFVIVPVLAWAVAQLLSLDEPFETGLLLVSAGAGAPFVIKLVQVARGDLALAAGLLVLQLVVTVAYMPLVLPVLLGDEVEVDTAGIGGTLAWTMLLPLAVGILVKRWSPEWAGRLQPYSQQISTVALLVLVGSTVLAHYDGILDIFGEGAIVAAALVIVAAFLSGYLLGGRREQTRAVAGLATGQRNIAAAMVVATQNFVDEPDVIVMVVVTSLIGLVLLFPAAWVARRRTGQAVGGAPRARPRAA